MFWGCSLAWDPYSPKVICRRFSCRRKRRLLRQKHKWQMLPTFETLYTRRSVCGKAGFSRTISMVGTGTELRARYRRLFTWQCYVIEKPLGADKLSAVPAAAEQNNGFSSGKVPGIVINFYCTADIWPLRQRSLPKSKVEVRLFGGRRSKSAQNDTMNEIFAQLSQMTQSWFWFASTAQIYWKSGLQ